MENTKESAVESRDPDLASGTVLICSQEGIVLEILKVTPEISSIHPGERLASWIDKDCQDKLASFYQSLESGQEPGIWELIYRDQEAVQPIFAAGLSSGETFLITLAREQSPTFQLLKTYSLQLEEFPAISFPDAPRFLGSESSEVDFFEELTRVNNQLISSQRLIQTQKAELAELNRVKDRFLGMAAHDLRNPLAAIMSYADFLTDELEGKISTEHEEFLSIIQSSSGFMLNLIEDLLDVSVISLGGMKLNRQQIDLAALMEETVKLNAPLAARKQIEVCFYVSESGNWQTVCDPTKISQMLNNLISNAIKFSYSGSQVQVGLERIAQQFRIEVKDQGQGIPDDQLERLFQLFETTTVQSTAGEKSTGLGLAISKTITEAHGGDISAENSPEGGTIFIVTLPVIQEADD